MWIFPRLLCEKGTHSSKSKYFDHWFMMQKESTLKSPKVARYNIFIYFLHFIWSWCKSSILQISIFKKTRVFDCDIAGDSTLNVNFAASFQDGTAACVASNTIAHWTEAITQLDGEFKFEPENLQYRNYLQGAMLLMDTCWVTKRSHTRLSWKRMRYHEDELLVC